MLPPTVVNGDGERPVVIVEGMWGRGEFVEAAGVELRTPGYGLLAADADES